MGGEAQFDSSVQMEYNNRFHLWFFWYLNREVRTIKEKQSIWFNSRPESEKRAGKEVTRKKGQKVTRKLKSLLWFKLGQYFIDKAKMLEYSFVSDNTEKLFLFPSLYNYQREVSTRGK